jgi:hypothetical protein
VTLDDAIDAQLTGNAGVSVIAGTRVYFAFPPQGAARPLVLYHLASNPRENIQGGEFTDKPTYDIGAWVDPGQSPAALADAITAALHNFGGLLGGGGGVAVNHILRTNQRSDTLDLRTGEFLVGSIITFDISM